VTRRNEHSPLSRIKALPYLDNVLALSEARAQGADDALMLNTGGTIACGTAANVFAIRGGRLETPPLRDAPCRAPCGRSCFPWRHRRACRRLKNRSI